jgi:hypothetical protein
MRNLEQLNGEKKMKLAISEDVLGKTTRCSRNFACLSGDKECLCELESQINNQVFFIRNNQQCGICDYKMSFGFSYICNCPTRKEVYNRYKI